MAKINRQTADPVILHAYEAMRYERRSPKLLLMANVIRMLAYGSILPIFLLPETARVPYLKVWMVVVAAALIMEFALMILWQPRGRKLKAAALIIGVITMAAAVLAGMWLLVLWLT